MIGLEIGVFVVVAVVAFYCGRCTDPLVNKNKPRYLYRIESDGSAIEVGAHTYDELMRLVEATELTKW